MSKSLPPLREELTLLPSAPLADGQPAWTLHDPARNVFFEIDWASFEILSRWGLADGQAVVEAIAAETTLHTDLEDVERMAQFLADNELLQPARQKAAGLSAQRRKRHGNWRQWLLHNYLFFRIPLVRPDRWLERALPYTDVFFGTGFARLTLLVATLGALGIYRDWERFAATFVDMLTWEGLLAYGVTLTVVHALHELGHAFTAKRFGCRVPTMGLAFLVMWPVAYTDINDAWKLTRRRQKLLVGGAGILTELAIAAWATLLWLFLPEGALKTAAFLVSTTTWISTLAVNASPFMRFDGYFLIVDALQMPNLHSRAFALARWDMRERLFGLQVEPPEHVTSPLRPALIAFAWATWTYRLVLFLGIAVLVYSHAFKLLGLLLFAVEIGWFVLLPLWSEIRIWWEIRERLRDNPKARRSALIFGVVALLFVLPWPNHIATSGLWMPANEQIVYAPAQAQMAVIHVRNGQHVETAEPLLELSSAQLDSRHREHRSRLEQLAWNSATAGLNPEQRKSWQILDSQLRGEKASQQELDAEALRHAPLATLAGTFVDADPDLKPGDWLAAREPLGRIVEDGPGQVVAYVTDDEVAYLAVGDRGIFLAAGGAGPNLSLEVADIARDASRILTEPELANLNGGSLAVREKSGQLFPDRAIYRVVLKVEGDAGIRQQHRWLGKVAMAGKWTAPGLRYLRHLISTLQKEAGF